MAKKYGLFCGDFHCGHLVGLTPPEYQHKFIQNSTTKRNKWYKITTSLWKNFDGILKRLPPLDFAVFNGDLVEGKGKKSGGTELITADMKEQCDMATKIINHVRQYGKKGMKTIATYGTDYHTSTLGDEWENVIASTAFIDKIGAHEWFEVNGLIFDVKHFIGGSSVPYGRYTAISKDVLWNELWAMVHMQPKADVLIRSHRHYCIECWEPHTRGIILPGLQGMGSKFGSKVCSGIVHWGMVLIEITNKYDYRVIPFVINIKAQRAKVMKL